MKTKKGELMLAYKIGKTIWEVYEVSTGEECYGYEYYIKRNGAVVETELESLSEADAQILLRYRID